MNRILNPRLLAGGLMAVLIFTFAPASALTSGTYENDVTKFTNAKRISAHKVPVKLQSCVDRYAEKQAAWMASHRTLKHQNLRTVLKGCHLTSVSENIAYGFSSGSKVVNAWMKSSGHRANLLSTNKRWIGVGAVKDKKGTWWVSQVFARK